MPSPASTLSTSQRKGSSNLGTNKKSSYSVQFSPVFTVHRLVVSPKTPPTSGLPSLYSPRSVVKSDKARRNMFAKITAPLLFDDKGDETNFPSDSSCTQETLSNSKESLLKEGFTSRSVQTFVSSNSIFEGDTSPLCKGFPITRKQEQFTFCRNIKTEVSFKDRNGAEIAVMKQKGKNRVLEDNTGRECASILHFKDKFGSNTFKIYGSRATKKNQRASQEASGFFSWAEVKNLGGLGGKFAMKLTRDFDDDGYAYVTKGFGSHFNLRKSRGHFIMNMKTERESVKMECLNSGKGVQVAPEEDLGLMLCFTAIVDKMVKERLR